jgi:hypothetical protein
MQYVLGEWRGGLGEIQRLSSCSWLHDSTLSEWLLVEALLITRAVKKNALNHFTIKCGLRSNTSHFPSLAGTGLMAALNPKVTGMESYNCTQRQAERAKVDHLIFLTLVGIAKLTQIITWNQNGVLC